MLGLLAGAVAASSAWSADSWTFVSIPDFLNTDTYYPETNWEDTLTYTLDAIQAENPDFVLVAGDLVCGRWWMGETTAERGSNIQNYADIYYPAWTQRFAGHGLPVYVAVGDHELGDDPWDPGNWMGVPDKIATVPFFEDAFVEHLAMPTNGPPGMEGLTYSFVHANCLFVALDVFETHGSDIEVTVSGVQLNWLTNTLAAHTGSVDHIIAMGHAPIAGPVRHRNSSRIMLDDGTGSDLWQAFREYGVDLYLCGEHHAITCIEADNILQVVHGALFGIHESGDYLVATVTPTNLFLELKRLSLFQTGGELAQPPWTIAGPYDTVRIAPPEKARGFRSVGTIRIDKQPGGRVYTNRTGVFAPNTPEDVLLHDAGGGAVVISWDAPAAAGGIQSYRVLRDGNEVGVVTGLSFVDTGVAAGETYTYVVEALDAASDGLGTSLPVTIPIPSDARAAHWRFDEGGGVTAADATGQGSTGVVANGAEWTNGIAGGALSFDGVDDHVFVDCPAFCNWRGRLTADLDWSGTWPAVGTYDGPFTVALWVKAATTNQPTATSVFNSFHNPTAGATEDSFQIDIEAVVPPRYRLYRNSTWLAFGPVRTQWVHLAVTYDGTTITTYQDGVPKDTDTPADGPLFRDCLVGVNRYMTSYFEGLIDEVRVYRRALAPGEIEWLVADPDDDGMADAWEIRHFGDNAHEQGDPEDDWDGDGFLNLYEYLAGTDPTNRFSALEVVGLSTESESSMVLQWSSEPDKSYAIWSTTNLVRGFVRERTNRIATTPPLNTCTVGVPSLPVFWRVGLDGQTAP